jgi:hypothetical protein
MDCSFFFFFFFYGQHEQALTLQSSNLYGNGDGIRTSPARLISVSNHMIGLRAVILGATVLVPTLAHCAEQATCPCRTPEDALAYYIDALRSGDNAKLRAVYPEGFELDDPVPVARYEIVKKETLAKDMKLGDSPRSTPDWAKAGTVRLDVMEVIAGANPAKYYYSFRKIGGKWLLLAHSSEADSDNFAE